MTGPSPTVYKTPWWVWVLLLWLVVLTAFGLIYVLPLKSHVSELSAWNKQMHRWAAHYYYCDSSHRDEAKCAQWSDHIPPPPPPPQY